jgi:hypothetical protein
MKTLRNSNRWLVAALYLALAVLAAYPQTGGRAHAFPKRTFEQVESSPKSAPPRARQLWGALTPGRFAVGLQVETVADRSRRRNDQAGEPPGRPIQIFTWYPASPPALARRLSFADYLSLADDPSAPASGRESQRRNLSLFINSEPDGVAADALDRILASRMFAVRNAAPAGGAYPLVLWSARHATPVAQSVLCEYLASHGYVVAFARYTGATLPLPYETKDGATRLATLNAHVRDLEFALAALSRKSNVERRRVAALSWSYAGESATRLQMRNANVRLVVSLSSNVLSGWVYQSAEALAELDVSQLTATYVLLAERIATNGAIRTAPPILDTLPAAAYFITFPELAHGNFNALEGSIPSLMGIAKVQRWSKPGPVAQLGYETVSRLTRLFLDAYLKQQPVALTGLAGWAGKQGLPEEFLTIARHGQAAAPDRNRRLK